MSFVIFVGNDSIAHSYKSDLFNGVQSSEAQKSVIDYDFKNSYLAVHTPLFCRKLEANEKLIDLYPKLIVSENYSNYHYPEYYLTVITEKDTTSYHKVHIDGGSTIQIPEFYVPFNVKSLESKTQNEILNQIRNFFKEDMIQPKLYILVNGKEESCEKMKGKDIFKDCPKLIVKCELTDATGKVTRIRHQVLMEIISTEKTYVADLTKLIDFWKENIIQKKMLTSEEIDVIFKDIPIILNCQKTFLAQLEKSGTEFGAVNAGDFIEFAQFFKISKPYISNYPRIVNILIEKGKHSKFHEFMENLAKQAGGRDLASYLITPVQRMPRYILFLRELLKCTPSFHPDHLLLQTAYNEIEKVTKQIDAASETAQMQLELYRIHTILSQSGTQILEAGRTLLKHSKLNVLKYPRYEVSKKKVNIFLFNDLLVISKETRNNKQKVLFNSLINDCRYIRSLPTLDCATFCSPSQTVTVQFDSPKDRDDFIKDMSKQMNKLPSSAYLFRDIAMDSLPPVLVDHQTVHIDSYLYIYGGKPAPKEFVVLDISNGLISYLNTTLPSLRGHSMCTINDTIYICGGQLANSSSYSNATWSGNPKNNQWIQIAKTGFQSRTGQSMCPWDDMLVVFGGKGSSASSFYNNVCIFNTKDIKSGWQLYNSLNNSPKARTGHTAIIYKDLLIVYGGKNDKTTFNDFQILDLKKLAGWETPKLSGDELPPRAFHQSVLIDNIMFTIGGNEDASIGQIINLDTLNVSTVKCYGNLPPQSLSSFSMTLTEDGGLIFIGGKIKSCETNLLLYLKAPIPPPRFKKNSVFCKPIFALEKDVINYKDPNEKQHCLLLPTSTDSTISPSTSATEEDIQVVIPGKDSFKISKLIESSIYVSMALAVLFFALSAKSRPLIIVGVIFLAATIIVIYLKSTIVKKKEEELTEILKKEIQINGGFVDRYAFLQKYNVSKVVYDAFLQNNIKTNQFIISDKNIGGAKFVAIELSPK